VDELRIEPIADDGTIRIRPIGFVRSPVPSQQTGGFEEVETSIELNPGFAGWLEGLAEYSHLIVLYWLGEQRRAFARTKPQGNANAPYVGMFACR
jgi:tRNA (Thr-GGU) A37 N-methylase